jgi:glycosyltransferase involved in cell wall biosynthesis
MKKKASKHKKKLALTIVVINKNQASHLRELLPTLTFAPVIVIDDFSTDCSEDVAKSNGAKVISHDSGGDFSNQRNFALGVCASSWVLFIDADERVSPALAEEIVAKLSKKPDVDGYYIQRRDVFRGKQLRYGETGYMSLLRLGKRLSGTWHRPVHEVWQIEKTEQLIQPLLHYSHNSLASTWSKLKRYAKREAEYRISAGP